MSDAPMPAQLRVSIEAGARSEDFAFVNQRLADYAKEAVGRIDYVPLTIFLRDETNRLRGGLLGYSIWSAMQIDTLWVEDGLRRHGHGKGLLAAAERAARIRGCKLIHAETYSEDALRFYEKAGYTTFGKLCIDAKLTRFYVSKSLAAPATIQSC